MVFSTKKMDLLRCTMFWMLSIYTTTLKTRLISGRGTFLLIMIVLDNLLVGERWFADELYIRSVMNFQKNLTKGLKHTYIDGVSSRWNVC